MDEDWDMCESILEFSLTSTGPQLDHFNDTPHSTTDDRKSEVERISPVLQDPNYMEFESYVSQTQSKETVMTESETKDTLQSHENITVQNLDCLYHGKLCRSCFQQLMNLLRKDVIPERYMKRLGSKVCNCKVKAGEDSMTMPSGKFSEEAKNNLVKTLLNKTSKAEAKPTSGLETALDKLLRTEPDCQTKHMCHLYHILRAACNGDFNLLEVPKKQTETKEEEIVAAPDPKIIEALRLPLPNQFVPHFVGKQGVHINQLATRLGVEIKIVSPCSLRRRPYFAPDGKTAIVEITAKTYEDLQTAKEEITKYAKYVTTKREKHQQRMVEHQKWIRERWERRRKEREQRNKERSKTNEIVSSIVYGSDADGGFHKDMDRKTYTTRYLHTISGNTMKVKPAPILEGSTCINCLGPYTGKENHKEACRFHAGFIVEDPTVGELAWSCCLETVRDSAGREIPGKKAMDKVDKYLLHKETGCTRGLHQWRPHRTTKNRNVGGGKTKEKRGKSAYNMRDIKQGLKNVELHGGKRKARAAMERSKDW